MDRWAVLSYIFPMPHRVLQATVDALQIPALVVATYNGNEIMAVSSQTHVEISENLLHGSNFRVVMKELGLNPDETAFAQVAGGHAEMASRLLHLEQRMDRPAWCVVSRMDEIEGWPPCVMVTIHTKPVDEQIARDYHHRDRLAVEMAVLLDRMRADTRQVARMASSAWQQVEHVSESFIERLGRVEPSLPHQ